jgi:hypothetical protein
MGRRRAEHRTASTIDHASGGRVLDNWEHIPFNLIKDFAYGQASLDELQLHHCANCDECSEAWGIFKREAQVIRRAKALGYETKVKITRLLKENSPERDERSA